MTSHSSSTTFGTRAWTRAEMSTSNSFQNGWHVCSCDRGILFLSHKSLAVGRCGGLDRRRQRRLDLDPVRRRYRSSNDVCSRPRCCNSTRDVPSELGSCELVWKRFGYRRDCRLVELSNQGG